MIAVADGVSSHPQAPNAAAAAVEALSERIDSLDAMRGAFIAASERVVALLHTARPTPRSCGL